jgi:broad specificity phosphatase PhoE
VIVLTRHGETEWSRDGRHTSRTDLPLTDTGREQARALGGRLSGRQFSLVLCSPRVRARETAKLAGFDDPEIDDDLVEWDYGDYEGRKTKDIRKERPGWELWRDGCPNGESFESIGARADRVLDRAVKLHGDVLVFSHGHMCRILGARWIGMPPQGGGAFVFGTAALSELGFERERHVIAAWNTR